MPATTLAASAVATKLPLRVPQARVLRTLMPKDPTSHWTDWPVLNRANLAVRTGYTAISGTITRALNGIAEGSSSGDAHPGLLARGLVKALALDLDGATEVNYRITAAGIREFAAYQADNGKRLPKVKDAALCVNARYAQPSA